MKFIKTLTIVGLLSIGVSYGESYYSDADSIFIAAYNPKETPSLKVVEYLKGKGSSESGLALLQAQARIKLNEPCEVVVIANYRKVVAPPNASIALPSCDSDIMFWIVKNGIVSIDGEEISIQKLKKSFKP